MKDLNYYLQLKYSIELVETDEGFVATHPDLPGCASFGDTAEEAINELGEVRRLWLEGQVEQNGIAPEPAPPEQHSGRFVVRIPKWLHRMLDREAQRQACSLNSFVVSLLSMGLGMKRSTEQMRPDEEWSTSFEVCKANQQWSIKNFLLPPERKRSVYLENLNSIIKRKREVGPHKHFTEQEDYYDVHEVDTKKPN